MFENIENICVFGAAGFIGSHYLRFLRENQFQGQLLGFDLIKNHDVYKEDVRKPINIDFQSFKDGIIINLAAVHRTPGHHDYDYFETNINGARNVCAFAEKKGINNIIFTSSIAPYGASEDLKTEETLPTPNSPYGISKLVAEHIHMEWAIKDSKRKLLIIRPGVVFGKGESGNYTRLYQAIRSGRFFYPGRKDTIKACIYVKDLIQLSFQIFRSYNSGVKMYNFTYEPAPTIEVIVKTISEVIGRKHVPKLVIPGTLLSTTAAILGALGFNKLGIHPERVKKLMNSTHISGRKIVENGFQFNYDLKSSIEDWYKDCNCSGLY